MVGSALFVLWLGAFGNPEIPQISRPVTDLAGVLGPAQESIARDLVAHRTRTGVQLAVLTVHSTEGVDIGDFAQETFDKWGGGTAGRDDGALFVLAVNDRRSRLHLGYGLEPAIPDAVALRMLDALKPSLRTGDYAGATNHLVGQFTNFTASFRPGVPYRPPLAIRPWLWLVVAFLGLAGGIAWRLVSLPVLEALDREVLFQTFEPEAPSRGRKRRALTNNPSTRIVGLVLASLQVLLLALTLPQLGLALVYTLVLWVWLGLGWLVVAFNLKVGGILGVGVIAALVYGYILAVAAPPFVDARALLEMAGLSLAGLAGGSFFAILVLAQHAAAQHGSSSFSSTSSFSSGSSSFSSRSSSFSGGSSSSTSWSGGGGRSGGGGASSSW